MPDTKRAAHLVERYGEKASAAYRERLEVEIEAAVLIDELMVADPTPNFAYSTWIVTTFIKDGFLFEDLLSKVTDTLRLFDANKRRLPQDRRDIGQYATLPDLWDVVKAYDRGEDETDDPGDLHGRERRRSERRKARDESVIVVEDDQWTVAIPLTVDAATWWGRGTRWCTAALSNNQFAAYHRLAPLIVIDIKGVGKFQLSASRYPQFMDCEDRPVKPEIVAAAWSHFRPILLSQVRRNPKVVRFALPAKDATFYRQAALTASESLQYAPADFQTFENIRPLLDDDIQIFHEIRNEAVRSALARDICSSHPELLWWVAYHEAPGSLWLRGIERDGKLLTRIPEDERTPEMCLAAMRGFGDGIDLVPRATRSEAMILAAIENSAGAAIAKIDVEERSEAACLRAVQLDGLLVNHVPIKMMTEQVLQTAVSQNSRALSFVPEFLQTGPLCEAAIKNDGAALCWAAPALRTSFLCAAAVANDPLALFHVPEDLRTLELCRRAVAANTLAMDAVPARFYGNFTFSFDDPAEIWRSAAAAGNADRETKPLWTDDIATAVAEVRARINAD